MHLLDEVFPEGDEEEDADDAAQEGGQEHLEEGGGHLRVVGIFRLKDVDGGEGEDGSCHDGARTGTDALDDDILAQGVLALGGGGGSHGDDGDGDGGLEHLAYLQSEVGGGGGEQHRHDDAPGHRPRVHLSILAVGAHDGFVFFPFRQFTKRILWQLKLLLVLLFLYHGVSFLMIFSL